MRICVYGAGVMGGLLGAGLARAGQDVCLIARGAHLAAIRAEGLRIRGGAHTYSVPLEASSDPADFGPQDLVIVSTKTPALPEIANRIGVLLGPDTLVAFANNGVFWFYGDGFTPNGLKLDTDRLDPSGALHAAIEPRRLLGMVCYPGGAINEPGVIDTSTPGRYVVGAAMKETINRANTLFAAIDVKDFDIVTTDDIRQTMWPKYLTVVGHHAIAALTGGNMSQYWNNPAIRKVAVSMMEEAAAVAAAHGYRDLGLDFAKLRAQGGTSTHRPSMLQDLERGRQMEIDAQYLVLQDLARQSGVETPILDTLVPLLVQRAQLAGCYSAPGSTADIA